jgi:hypothetical protein
MSYLRHKRKFFQENGKPECSGSKKKPGELIDKRLPPTARGSGSVKKSAPATISTRRGCAEPHESMQQNKPRGPTFCGPVHGARVLKLICCDNDLVFVSADR